MISLIRNMLRRRARPAPARPDRTIWTVMTEAVEHNPTPEPDKVMRGINELRSLCPHPEDYLHRLLRLLALHRSVVIQQKLLQTIAPEVQSGPFSGMILPSSSKEGCYVPKLLGTYESALHPEWERIIQRGYSTIVNIGCADGYYAVGLARRMPKARILAYDICPAARDACRNLARLNGVEERLEIGGEFSKADFPTLPRDDIFVVCDIEGAERSLLDPEQVPSLRRLDLLVELHNLTRHDTETLLRARFQGSHHMQRIDTGTPSLPALPFPDDMDELDKLIALWEWRVEATPWLILQARDAT